MKKHFGLSLMLTALVSILLLVSACGSTNTATNTSSRTPLQVLQNTQTAMKQLKSVHLDLKFNVAIQVSGTPTATDGTSAAPQNLSLNFTGSGDEVPPNQASIHLSIAQSASDQGLNLSEILVGNKAYIQNSHGQWYVLDKSELPGSNNPFSGTDISNVYNLLDAAQKAKVTDHGTESLNGQNLRHLSFSFDQQSLSQLLSSNGQLGSILDQQNIAQVLNNVKLSQATLDVWIDESTSYVHRVELKMNLGLNLSSLDNAATPTASGTVLPNITTEVDSIIDLSKFNAPVTITAPANAIPTDDPSAIFS